MNRLWLAMGAYVFLAILAWTQLDAPIPHSEFQLRHVVIAVLLALAVSTWMHRRDREERGANSGR
jgi:uncharacterized membrane protein YadS